tara:strand:- start:18373 stop:18630 length:258 start_codon:yes stop_codon:yes gene_type:complete
MWQLKSKYFLAIVTCSIAVTAIAEVSAQQKRGTRPALSVVVEVVRQKVGNDQAEAGFPITILLRRIVSADEIVDNRSNLISVFGR